MSVVGSVLLFYCCSGPLLIDKRDSESERERERRAKMLIISWIRAQKIFCPTLPDFNQSLKIVADCNRHSEVTRGV